MTIESKIIKDPAELVEWRRESGFGSQPIAVVSGAFDLLHPGNLALLRLAWQRVGQLCVAVEPDADITERGGMGRPWCPVEERMETLAHFEAVSALFTCPTGEVSSFLGGITPCAHVSCPKIGYTAFDSAVSSACDSRVEVPLLDGCSSGDVVEAVRTNGTPLDLPLDYEVSRDDETGASRTGRVVTVNGCFDVLHIGHLRFLADAAAMGESLIVLLNSDSSVQGYKGPTRPVYPEEFRVSALRALESVADVVLFEEDNPLSVLEEIQPDIHVKGGSYEPDRAADEKKLVESWGGKLEFCPLVPGFSTTAWVDRVSIQ